MSPAQTSPLNPSSRPPWPPLGHAVLRINTTKKMNRSCHAQDRNCPCRWILKSSVLTLSRRKVGARVLWWQRRGRWVQCSSCACIRCHGLQSVDRREHPLRREGRQWGPPRKYLDPSDQWWRGLLDRRRNAQSRAACANPSGNGLRPHRRHDSAAWWP